MIRVSSIQYKYDSDFIIEDINFDLEKGETLAIVGPSGSGKTTVLKLILGAFIPDSGIIEIDGINVTNLAIEKRNIGYCPQDQLLFPHLNVFNNIAIGLGEKKLSKNRIKAEVESLASMSGIFPLLSRKSDQLSGGQKQRVSILRALAIQPKVLLLDEPFHNLDAQIKSQIVNYIKKIQSITNVTVILVTHDISEAKALADKILIINNGKMIQFGSPSILLTAPKNYEVAKIMGIPNIFLIFKQVVESAEITTLFVSFGKLTVNKHIDKDAEAIYIDQKAITLVEKENDLRNVFQGLVKGIVIDLFAQKRILSIQIQIRENVENEYDDLDANIQFITDLQGRIFEKNQNLLVQINTLELTIL